MESDLTPAMIINFRTAAERATARAKPIWQVLPDAIGLTRCDTLLRVGTRTLGDLEGEHFTFFHGLYGFGPKTVAKIDAVLAAHGLATIDHKRWSLVEPLRQNLLDLLPPDRVEVVLPSVLRSLGGSSPGRRSAKHSRPQPG